MNRYKKLVGNSLIFAIGNLGSKLMQFIMIPLYSYTLTTTQYGKVDFLTTVVSLLLPVFSLDIYDAAFRFALDKSDNRTQTLNTSLLFITLVSIGLMPLTILLQLLIKDYPLLNTGFLLIASMFFSLISNYARAINKIKQFAIAGIINSLTMGLMSFMLLYCFHWAMNGYLFSMAIGMVIATIYIIIACHLQLIFNLQSASKEKLSSLFKYSIPLVPNLLAWWLNSTSDRLFILMLIGASANGIYAMASKIPNMLSTLMTIFLQSWQISVVEEYKEVKGKEFITNVFQAFLTTIFIVAIGILMFLKLIFHILVSSSYYTGWHVAPLILLSVVYSTIASFLGTIYTASKQTVPIMYTTVIGAIINIIFSLILISAIGINGAALANIISFAVVSFYRYRDIRRDDKIQINWVHFVILHFLFIICTLANYCSDNIVIPFLCGLASLVILMFFDSNFKVLWKLVQAKFNRNK